MKYLKISILRNRLVYGQYLAFLKVYPDKCDNYVFYGNEIRRGLLKNLVRYS